MFSKSAKGVVAPTGKTELATLPSPSELVGKTKARPASLLAENLTIEGNLSGEGEVQIDGVVRGDVHVSKVTVGETGHVEGSIHADTVEIRGRIIGAVTAKQVRLHGTGYVDGDITHEQLAMESGAFFQGRSLKFQRPASQAPTVSVATPEMKTA